MPVKIKGVECLSTKEAASLLGYSVEYLRRLARANRIPAMRYENKSKTRWYFPKYDLLEDILNGL